MTPEEFDAQVAEWDRRHAALTRKLDAMDEMAARRLVDSIANLIARRGGGSSGGGGGPGRTESKDARHE